MTVRRSQTKHVTPDHANIQADEPDNILALNIPVKDFRAKQDEAYAEYQQKMNNLLNDASGIVSGIVSNNELEQFRPAMEELVARQKKITEDYYFKIRTMSAQDGGATLPEYVKVPDTDANRAMWKTVGGFYHTDYNGLRYRDVITGNNAAGKTMDDVWDLGYRKFPLDPNTMDYGPWEDLAHELLYNADRLHMTRLTEADPSQPRYARVPHGPACEFCIMLAGRGFVYHSSKSAGGEFHTYHAHDHCSVIPSWNKQNLTHYDPEGMKERYEQCATTVQYLTTEDLYERYVEAELEKQKDLKKEDQKWKTYSEWKRDIILTEMRTRSRDWLYDGQITPPVIQTGAKPLEKEKKVGVILADNGFYVLHRDVAHTEGIKSPDLSLSNGNSEKLWEIKRPEKTGKQNIYHQLEEAALQTNRVVVDCTKVEELLSREEILQRFDKCKNYSYTNENGTKIKFAEILATFNDGIIRIK